MRRHPNALIAMTYAGMLAACAAPVAASGDTEEERKTPPPSPTPEPAPAPAATNLPGETNRQFAARMKAAKS